MEVKSDLEIFARLALIGNQHEACVQMAVSPDDILAHIKNLETRVGRQLFIYDQEKAVLTDAGQELYDQIITQCQNHIDLE